MTENLDTKLTESDIAHLAKIFDILAQWDYEESERVLLVLDLHGLGRAIEYLAQSVRVIRMELDIANDLE